MNLEGQKFLFPMIECQGCAKESYNHGLCDKCVEDYLAHFKERLASGTEGIAVRFDD